MESRPHSQSNSAPLTCLRAPWDEVVVHGFLGRTGGVSAGAYATLNLGQHVGDDPAAVAENLRRVRAELGRGGEFARVNQVHGAEVMVIARDNSAERPRADGMVTGVPILMRSKRSGVVAALHAGWRGVIAGIAREGVAAMSSLGARPRDIAAALGPSIGLCCFEVDDELAARFVREIAGADRHCRAGRSGKAYLDLRAVLRDQLIAAGLDPPEIALVGPCTRCASDRFFSRRAAGGITTGLQMSFIGLAED
jgi:YfiH family protein